MLYLLSLSYPSKRPVLRNKEIKRLSYNSLATARDYAHFEYPHSKFWLILKLNVHPLTSDKYVTISVKICDFKFDK